MSKKTNKKADWKTSENRRFIYIGKLATSKGIGVVQYDGKRISINILLKVILNGVDLEQFAYVETKEIQDMAVAHDWVESFLL